jgi:transcriptional regulator with XRE-family HTH domain
VLNLITGRQLRAARGLLGWGQIELAKKAKVAIGTIRRMESFDEEVGCQASTLYKVRTALEKGGIEFLHDDKPGVRLNAVKFLDEIGGEPLEGSGFEDETPDEEFG